MKRIYLDHAAATPIDEGAEKVMRETERKFFANPAALHAEGIEAAQVLEEARASIAEEISAQPEAITFTASATEANALAILGGAREARKRYGKDHIILSSVEHPSVVECGEKLRREGFTVEYAPVSEEGVVDSSELSRMLRDETALVSIIYANNEVGTIQPIREISKVLRGFRKKISEEAHAGNPKNRALFPYFHVDAAQAVNYLEMNVVRLGVDLLSFNSAKIYGPRGAAALFSRDVSLEPIVFGGGQENGLRSGTQDLARIAGFSRALEKASEIREHESARLIELRDHFIERVTNETPEAILNGSPQNRLPNNVNFSLPGWDAEELLLRLDAHGIAASTRSACSSQSEGGSYVVRALGEKLSENDRQAKIHPFSSIRFSLGRKTKTQDIDRTVEALKKITQKF